MTHLETKTKRYYPPCRSPRLCSESKNLVHNVFKYFRRQGDYESISEIDQRTSNASHVHFTMIKKIRTEAKKSECGFIKSPPPRKRTRCISDTVLNDFGKEIIRKEILNLFERRERPTLDLLLEKVKEPPLLFRGCRTTLWRVVKELGYSYKRDGNGKAILVMRYDNVSHDIKNKASSTHYLLQRQAENMSEDDKEGAESNDSEDVGMITVSTARSHLKDILNLIDSGKYSFLHIFGQIFKEAFQASEIREVQTHDRPRPARQSKLTIQSRKVVLNVFNYFKARVRYECLTEIEDKTAEATQVTRRLVRNIGNEGGISESESVDSPQKKSEDSCHELNSEVNFDEVIRREILGLCEKGEQPTLDMLLERVKEPPIAYHGDRTMLLKLVNDLGYKCKRHDSSRAMLIETDDAENHEKNNLSSKQHQREEEFTDENYEKRSENKVNDGVEIISLSTLRNYLDDILDLIDSFKATSLHEYYWTFKDARNAVFEYQHPELMQVKASDHLESPASVASRDSSNTSIDLPSSSSSQPVSSGFSNTSVESGDSSSTSIDLPSSSASQSKPRTVAWVFIPVIPRIVVSMRGDPLAVKEGLKDSQTLENKEDDEEQKTEKSEMEVKEDVTVGQDILYDDKIEPMMKASECLPVMLDDTLCIKTEPKMDEALKKEVQGGSRMVDDIGENELCEVKMEVEIKEEVTVENEFLYEEKIFTAGGICEASNSGTRQDGRCIDSDLHPGFS